MVALVLSAWHIVGAQQITDFLPSSPDIPGFTIPTLCFSPFSSSSSRESVFQYK